MSVTILNGDVREQLRLLPDKSVQCVVTSPPYFGLRAYGTAPQVWGGIDHAHDWDAVPSPGSRSSDTKPGPLQHAGNKNRERLLSDVCACGAWRGELGLEPTPALFIEHLVAIFDEIWRVLRDDGVAFCNLADSYANDAKWGGSSGGKHVEGLHGKTGIGRQKRETGVRAKSLMLIPQRFAIGMADRGWIVRSQVAWTKASAMPESVVDRPTSSWEPIFMFTKSPRYFYDAMGYRPESGANARNHWHLSPEGSGLEHFASYPTELVRRCVLLGSSEKGQCPACGAAWRRVVERERYEPPVVDVGVRAVDASRGDKTRKLDGKSAAWRESATSAKTTGWEPSCQCDAGAPVPQLVLDPFGGSGTTGVVADRLGRDAILIELSPVYAAMCERRLRADAGMFANVEVVA